MRSIRRSAPAPPKTSTWLLNRCKLLDLIRRRW
jgi:hypothetical protein